MRVVLANRRATVTIQDYRVRFKELSGSEYTGEAVDVEDYSIVREEPSASYLVKRESWEALHDLRDLGTTPLDQNTHREGWLRFRIPKLPYEPKHGEVTLEIFDALDRLHKIKVSDPWPQAGYIALT